MTEREAEASMREAVPGDAEAIDRLLCYLHCFHAEARPDMFRPVAGEPRGEDFLPRVLDDPQQTILVATLRGQVAGHVHILLKEAPASPDRVPRRYGEIDSLAVLPEAQGLGLGRKLIQAALDWLVGQGVDDHQIAVHAFNTSALRLYQSFGFAPSVTMLRRKG